MKRARNARQTVLLACMSLLSLPLSTCGPSLTRAHAESLVDARHALLEYPEGEIPASRWPKSVADLEPERVYRSYEGVYIITSEFFVEQRGVFILDTTSSFVPSRFQDPSYDVVIAGVFIYRSAG